MTIQEQIKALRRWAAIDGVPLIAHRYETCADTIERLNAVYEAALTWERDENRTDETEHNLIMAVQAAVKDS